MIDNKMYLQRNGDEVELHQISHHAAQMHKY